MPTSAIARRGVREICDTSRSSVSSAPCPTFIGNTRTQLVTLTERGRDVLEDASRGRDRGSGQTFYAGIAKPRELAHDAHLYRAYTKAADRLVGQGAHIRRVVLEEALKRDYQQFLQASNRR